MITLAHIQILIFILILIIYLHWVLIERAYAWCHLSAVIWRWFEASKAWSEWRLFLLIIKYNYLILISFFNFVSIESWLLVFILIWINFEILKLIDQLLLKIGSRPGHCVIQKTGPFIRCFNIYVNLILWLFVIVFMFLFTLQCIIILILSW